MKFNHVPLRKPLGSARLAPSDMDNATFAASRTAYFGASSSSDKDQWQANAIGLSSLGHGVMLAPNMVVGQPGRAAASSADRNSAPASCGRAFASATQAQLGASRQAGKNVSQRSPMKVNATPTVDASMRIGERGRAWQEDPIRVDMDNKFQFRVVDSAFDQQQTTHGGLIPDVAPPFLCGSGSATLYQSADFVHEIATYQYNMFNAGVHALPQGPRASSMHALWDPNGLANNGSFRLPEAEFNQAAKVVPRENILAAGMDVMTAGLANSNISGLNGRYGRVLRYNEATDTYEVEFLWPKSDKGGVETSMAMPRRESGERVECKLTKDRFRLKNKALPKPNVPGTNPSNAGPVEERHAVPKTPNDDADTKNAASAKRIGTKSFKSVRFQATPQKKKGSRLLNALNIDDA